MVVEIFRTSRLTAFLMLCRLVYNIASHFNKLNLTCSIYFKSKYQVDVFPWDLNKFYTISCMLLLLLISIGDIELNPDPRKNDTSYNFSFCQWNLNSIAAIFLNCFYVKAFSILIKNDMICVWQTFLGSSISSNDKILYIKRYKLIRARNPSCSWYVSIIKNS